jgi:hypothetical protein
MAFQTPITVKEAIGNVSSCPCRLPLVALFLLLSSFVSAQTPEESGHHPQLERLTL